MSENEGERAQLSHDEIRELLGAYALDAIEADEAEVVELHLRDCPKCRAEVTEHREVAALLAHTGAPAPDGVWDRIVEALEVAPPPLRMPLPPTPVAPVVSIESARRSVALRVAAAAASVAAVIAAVLGVVVVRQGDRLDDVQAAMQDISLDGVAAAAMADPEAIRTELRSADGAVRAPAVLGDDGTGYMLAHGLPDLPADRTYQLWGTVGEQTVSLGIFGGDATTVPFRVDPTVSALAVTQEVAGGVAASANEAVLTGTTS
ncbi:hypothetical protein BH20ACT2_BH20ACT2_07370 [soil metagenome]